MKKSSLLQILTCNYNILIVQEYVHLLNLKIKKDDALDGGDFCYCIRLRLLRFRHPVFATIDFDRIHSMAVHHCHIHWLEMLPWLFSYFFFPAKALSVVESAVAPINITVTAATIRRCLLFILLIICNHCLAFLF